MTAPTTVRAALPGATDAVTIRYTEAGILTVERGPRRPGEELPMVTPGLIDLQVNGYAGLDVNAPDVTAEQIAELTVRLSRIGVTAWAPTIITAPEERIVHALRAVARARRENPVVHAAIPWVHVEGPFISGQDGARGVHDPAAVRPLDADEVARWCAHGPVGMVTVSPHTDDAEAQIAAVHAAGIGVAIGHTHATPEQIRSAVDAGARFSTHLGNGIPPVLPRHPNPIWTQLADDRLAAGLIADGHHLPADVLEVMLRVKTVERAYLVSDLTAIGGQPVGRYTTPVGGEVELDESGRLSYLGTEMLAGAAATVVDGVRTVARSTSLSWREALLLVTRTPGRLLGPGRPGAGTLAPGAPADLVFWTGTGAGAGVGEGAGGGAEPQAVSRVIQSGRPVR